MQCRLIIDLCPSKRPDGKNNTLGGAQKGGMVDAVGQHPSPRR